MFNTNKAKCIFLLVFTCLLSGCGITTEVPKVTGTEIQEEKAESDESILKEAISYIQEKRYPQAIGLLSKVEDNKQAEELLKQLRYIISGSYIANINAGVAAIDNNGKVKIAIDDIIYKSNGLGKSSNWTNIVSLSAGGGRLDALDKEGSIHCTGDIEPYDKAVVEQLHSYTDISILSTDYGDYVTLSKTGRVDAYNESTDALDLFRDEISKLKDVVDVVTGQIRMAALKKDGTVYVADYNKYLNTPDSYFYDEVADWTDIVDISAESIGSIAGLKSDGTVVVSTSDNKYISFDVSGWNDIIAISKGNNSLLGLKRDGTVVATGNNEHKQLEVSDWHDIVAIAAGDWISIGLKSDGTLVIAGEVEDGVDQPDVSNINNLYVPTIKLPS